MKKILTYVLIVLVIAIGIVIAKYQYPVITSSNNSGYSQHSVAIPDGWKRYENSDWGFSFAYPADWTIKERRLTQNDKTSSGTSAPIGQFLGVTLTGGGYSIIFDNGGRDLPSEYTYSHPQYTIDGTNVTATKYETDSKFGLFLSLPLKNPHSKVQNIVVRVGNTDPHVKYSSIIDQILSTIQLH